MTLTLLILLLPIILLLVLKRNKLNLPPSPLKLPIIGNLHQLGTLPHRSLHSLSLKHGPLMLLHLGQTPTLVVSSPDLIKQIVKSHDTTFSNRPQTTAPRILFYNCHDMGFSPYGEYWRNIRKLCVQELLSAKRIHSFQHIIDQEIKTMINNIEQNGIQRGYVDLTETIRSVVNDIVARCVLGRKAESGGRLRELTKKMMNDMASFCFGDFVPWLGWVDVVSGRVGRIKKTFDGFDCLFDLVIEEHKSGFVSENEDVERIDFVDILLQLQRNNTVDMELTDDNIKAILLDMIVAGTDTTSTVLEWAMSELIRNPNKMKKVQEEVRNTISKNNTSKVSPKDIEELEYFKCVFRETLRLHPPAPLLIPRETKTKIKLGGYDIPEKTTVFINTWASQMDPNIWNRPEEFIPERFLNNPIDYKGLDFHYIPFGTGRRGCPGITFGVTIIEFVLANLLYYFDWKLFGSMELDMSEANGVTVTKRLPLLLEPIMQYSP